MNHYPLTGIALTDEVAIQQEVISIFDDYGDMMRSAGGAEALMNCIVRPLMKLAAPKSIEPASRDSRQQTIFNWCSTAFGSEHASSIQQRGVRLFEEAIELYQACGADREMAHSLVDHVFANPPGSIGQEMGGVGVTILALAHAAGLSADEEEIREITRVLSKPLEYFAARNKVKNAAGFNVTRGNVPSPSCGFCFGCGVVCEAHEDTPTGTGLPGDCACGATGIPCLCVAQPATLVEAERSKV